MKVKSLKLSNFAKYSEVSVSFNENVTYLVGPNGAGKSTLGVDGLWFVLQGVAEKATKGVSPIIAERFRFIGNSGKTAVGELVLVDDKIGEVKVTRRMTKDGSSLVFEGPAGKTLDQEWLNGIFNIFLINPESFISLSPEQQAIALGIDLSQYDATLKALKEEYTLINRTVRSAGELVPVEKIEKVSVSDLFEQRKVIEKFNKEQDEKEAKIRGANEKIDELSRSADAMSAEIGKTEELLRTMKEHEKTLRDRIVVGNNYVETLPCPEQKKFTHDIDQQIESADKINVQANQYAQYITKKAELDKSNAALEANKTKQEKVLEDRTNAVKAKKLPFDALAVDENGGLLLYGKPVKPQYFSSGELLKLVPVIMSSLNPDLKYVFLQQWDLLDETNQAKVEEYLTSKGFQLVIEKVGTNAPKAKNVIRLKNMKVVESFDEKVETVI